MREVTETHHRRPSRVAVPLVAFAVALGVACQLTSGVLAGALPTAPSAGIAGSKAVPLPKVVARTCQGCHSVRAHLPSPNPAAPGFEDIANLEGLTPNTLAAFLRDAHNYPDEMEMTLTDDEIDAVVTYVLTLSTPDYRHAR